MRHARAVRLSLALAALVVTSLMVYYATLSLAHFSKEQVGDYAKLPQPAKTVIFVTRYHVFPIVGAIVVAALVAVELRVRDEGTKTVAFYAAAIVALLCVATMFFSMSMPFQCMCDEWKQW